MMERFYKRAKLLINKMLLNQRYRCEQCYAIIESRQIYIDGKLLENRCPICGSRSLTLL